MPPHCDTMDGPVVKAAKQALEKEDVKIIIPYAPKSSEKEITETFKKVISAKKSGKQAKEIAELYFFETVVRLHRAGEGAPFTGLKPAGLSEGPIIPIAEKAIEKESEDELITTLCDFTTKEIEDRFSKMLELKKRKEKSTDDARKYVSSMLGLQVYCHKIYLALTSRSHEENKHAKEIHEH